MAQSGPTPKSHLRTTSSNGSLDANGSCCGQLSLFTWLRVVSSKDQMSQCFAALPRLLGICGLRCCTPRIANSAPNFKTSLIGNAPIQRPSRLGNLLLFVPSGCVPDVSKETEQLEAREASGSAATRVILRQAVAPPCKPQCSWFVCTTGSELCGQRKPHAGAKGF